MVSNLILPLKKGNILGWNPIIDENHESLDGPEAWSWIAASPDKSLHAYFSKSENGGFTPFLAIYREHSYELWDFELFPIISDAA